MRGDRGRGGAVGGCIRDGLTGQGVDRGESPAALGTVASQLPGLMVRLRESKINTISGVFQSTVSSSL